MALKLTPNCWALWPLLPPNYQEYSPWKCPAGPACGPSGLLLHQLRDNFMGMNANLVIFDGNWGQFDLLKAPFQHMKPWLHQASCNARSVLAASSRTELKDMPLFDYLAYSAIMKRIPADRRNRIKLIHCCGGASPVKLHQLATCIDQRCPPLRPSQRGHHSLNLAMRSLQKHQIQGSATP